MINDQLGQSINNIDLESVRVGIIGGGIMGRLILNSLLVFEKQGLKASNITLSTRQCDDLQHYNSQFGVKVDFDNETTARESDIVIITVPSTLDNWVINDIKDSLL